MHEIIVSYMDERETLRTTIKIAIVYYITEDLQTYKKY